METSVPFDGMGNMPVRVSTLGRSISPTRCRGDSEGSYYDLNSSSSTFGGANAILVVIL